MKAATRVAAVLFTLLSLRSAVHAQGLPGNAPGSQTGDSSGPYTGIASSPDANHFTGSAQTSIPIEVPPGRLGLAPVLALSYSSNAGASVYGHGWNLALPQVHRSTKLGTPRYDDDDRFVLEMPGAVLELERIPGSPRGFRAEIESGFLRIGFHDADNTWKVVDKLGVTFTFGSTPATRLGRGAARGETFAWLLERVEDAAGNRIDFRYEGGGAGGTSNGRPQLISYGANARMGAAHFAEVRFEWSALLHAGPSRISCREGIARRLDRRLSAIETWTHGLRARRYDFSHEEDAITADLRLIGATLTAFAEDPADDVRLPSTVFVYARTNFAGWPAMGSLTDLRGSWEVPDVGYLRLGRKEITLDSVDLNGDAIADRVMPNDRGVQIGDGRAFSARRSWNWPTSTNAPKFVRKTDGGGNLSINVFDLDGDSFADLVDTNPLACAAPAGSWCVWRGSTDGFAATATRWASPVALLRASRDGGKRIVSDLIDFDADGRPDLVDASAYDETVGIDYWKLYRNTGSGFEKTAQQWPAPVPWLARSEGPRLVYGLFDINADSLPDLVSADEEDGGGLPKWDGFAAWHVYFNDGRAFTARQPWPVDEGPGLARGLPNFVNLHATDGTVIGDLFDITGDGRPDLVRRWRQTDPLGPNAPPDDCRPSSRCLLPEEFASAVSPGFCCYNILVYANTGSSFAQPMGWTSPAHGLRADYDQCPDDNSIACLGMTLHDYDFFDVDGDGLVEFVERFYSGGKPGSWLVHPHPASPSMGGTRPNLLLAMRNGVGGETMLRYRPATGTAQTRLPFPHWVVEERELRDSIYDDAALVTSYAYRGGWFDPMDREMRGFAAVQEVSPVGLSRVRQYHQDRRRAGRMHRLDLLGAPDCVAIDPEDPDDACSPWSFPLGTTEYRWPASGPVLLESESDVPSHDGAVIENLRRTTAYAYDDYGNVTKRRVETPMAATTTTLSEYAYRVADRPGGLPGQYNVSKPSRVLTLEEGRPTPLVERGFEYDWNSASPGLLSSASTCVEWNVSDCSQWSRRSFAYDGYGNLTLARSPDGAASRTDYDSKALFALRSTDPVGLVTESVTDPRTGNVTSTIAPNGNELRSDFDGLGRLLRTWGPGSSRAHPLKSFAYAPGKLGGNRPRLHSIDAASGSSTQFFDGLGRSVASKQSSHVGAEAVSVVTGFKRYDARGLVVKQTLPFDSRDLDTTTLSESFEDAPAWLEFEHDDAGRLVLTRAPDGTVTREDSSVPGIRRREHANFESRNFPGSLTLEVFDGLGHRLLREVCSAAPSPEAPYACPAGSLLRRESWLYDGLGRVTETRTHALGAAAGDAVTRIDYDGLGNRRSVFHSNAGQWQFRHDGSGRPIEVTKPDGTVIRTKYDAGGRVLRRRGPNSGAVYRYHAAGGGIGKIRRITNRTRQVRVTQDLVYDERGRVAARQRRVAPRRALPAEIRTAYSYDDFDRRIATEYEGWGVDGEAVVHRDYDAEGRESRLWTDDFEYVRRADYDSAGRLRRTDYGNGISDLVEYEERDNETRRAGYLRCLRTTATALAETGACSVASEDLEARFYSSYDRAGNLLSVDDALRDASHPLHETLRYQYDALGRLVLSGPVGARERYSFDALGNLTTNGRLQLDFLDPSHPSRLSSHRSANGLAVPVEHDAVGRRIRDGERRFGWDDNDRLESLHIGGVLTEEYGYMDSGERVYRHDLAGDRYEFDLGDGIRIDGGELERTLFFGGRVLAVERRSGVPRAMRAAGSDRAITALQRVFVHQDHQQSVKVISDGAGRAVEYSRYRPFGERRARFDALGRVVEDSRTRFAYTGHVAQEDAGLLFMGARYYDPKTASFLSLDPRMQFASPYAYSGGNPVLGRDPDGSVFALSTLEIVIALVGTATFVDSLVSTGDLGHSLTAGVYAGFSVYLSSQMSTAIARPLAGSSSTWMQMAASVASDGFQAMEAVSAIEDGRYAGGIVAAGMLAASLIGIESVADPGPGSTDDEHYRRHGIKDRGMKEGRRVIDVDGICATRGGCISNSVIAMRENIRILFGGKANCVGGCQYIGEMVQGAFAEGQDVLLRCNSYGAIKCLGALNNPKLSESLSMPGPKGSPKLTVEMSGAPILRPPRMQSVTYQVNLFDPVVWVGTGFSTSLRSDVVVGKNWWVPAPLIVHHTAMYERPFVEALGEMLP